MAHIASAHNMLVVPHTLAGLGQVANLHFAAAIPAPRASHVEWDPTPRNPLVEKLLTYPLKVVDGYLMVPRGPGLGADINWDVVKELQRDYGAD